MAQKTYILIRHGETIWNKKQKLMGIRDIKLTPAGKKQAKALGKYLRSYPIDVIFSSPLTRTIDTAREVQKYHKKTPLILAEEVIERAFGQLEGLPYDEVNRRHSALVYSESWKYTHFQPPGGERLVDVQKRAQNFLEMVKKTDYERVAIVSHGVFLRILFTTLLGLSIDAVATSLDNTSITIVSAAKDGTMHPHFFNNTVHLKEGNES